MMPPADDALQATVCQSLCRDQRCHLAFSESLSSVKGVLPKRSRRLHACEIGGEKPEKRRLKPAATRAIGDFEFGQHALKT